MKLLAALCVIAFVGCAAAKPGNDRGCIWIEGRCSQGCPEGTHSYTTGCGYLTPEATCENPEPKEDTRGKICDYSSCHCDPPTVRETNSRKCIPLDQCPKQE